MDQEKRIKQLESDVAILNHNLDEALTMIVQVQQAVLESDMTIESSHKALGKLAESLLNFYKNYEAMQSVK